MSRYERSRSEGTLPLLLGLAAFNISCLIRAVVRLTNDIDSGRKVQVLRALLRKGEYFKLSCQLVPPALEIRSYST